MSLASLSAEQVTYLIWHHEGLADALEKEHKYQRNSGSRPQTQAERDEHVAMWAMQAKAHRSAAESLRSATPSDGEVKRMLLEVLLGIGMIFGCTLEEMQNDPAIIIIRIEQSLGPNGPRGRKS